MTHSTLKTSFPLRLGTDTVANQVRGKGHAFLRAQAPRVCKIGLVYFSKIEPGGLRKQIER